MNVKNEKFYERQMGAISDYQDTKNPADLTKKKKGLPASGDVIDIFNYLNDFPEEQDEVIREDFYENILCDDEKLERQPLKEYLEQQKMAELGIKFKSLTSDDRDYIFKKNDQKAVVNKEKVTNMKEAMAQLDKKKPEISYHDANYPHLKIDAPRLNKVK